MKQIIKKASYLAGIAAITLASCNRSSNSPALSADDNGGYASDYSRMEQNSNDVVSISDAAAASNNGSNFRTTHDESVLGDCATVTNDTTSMPHVLTIDFGPTDCTSTVDHKNRRGKIIVTYSGHYKDSGSTRTITYDNYFVNDNQLLGSKTVTNKGMNGAGQVYYAITLNDSLYLGPGNGYIVWASTNRTRTWNTGYSTPERSDDSYFIQGTSTLTRANGKVFTFTITSPLLVAFNCPYIEEGILTVTGPSGGTRTLDYGSGNCDSEAQLTLNGHTYNITLK